ncbi:MAG: hypothetical protein AAF389_10005 [Gemmatimonadota bacterium]
MTDHVSPERMNDAIDGLLSAAERSEMEAKIERHEESRHEYARLSEVVTAVRSLPRAATPATDAWAVIAERIAGAEQETVREAEVVPIASAWAEEAEAPGARTAVRLSWGQLAAAAALVAAVSAATMWFALDGGRAGAGAAEIASVEFGGAAARVVSLEGSSYGDLVGELEAILEEGRALLDTETLVTIEESLRTVEAAIAEVEGALANDPNSDLLLRLLATHQRTRLGVLQRAADAVLQKA